MNRAFGIAGARRLGRPPLPADPSSTLISTYLMLLANPWQGRVPLARSGRVSSSRIRGARPFGSCDFRSAEVRSLRVETNPMGPGANAAITGRYDTRSGGEDGSTII